MTRILIAATVAASLFATNLLAAETATPPGAGPLAPGQAAGVKNAQDFNAKTLLWLVGLSGLGILIGITVGQSSGKAVTSTAT